MDNQITILLLGLIAVVLTLATSSIYETRKFLEDEIEEMKQEIERMKGADDERN